MSTDDGTKQPNTKSLQFNGLEYLGIAAGLFALIGGMEQLIHTYNKKRADDISYIFILGAIISAILWVIYHYRKRGGGPFLVTVVTLIGLFILLIMKMVYGNNNNDDDDDDDDDEKDKTN
jgi:uncharacterized protein with PQ loop repeat